MPTTLRGRSVLVVLIVGVLSVLPSVAATAHSAMTGSNPTSGSTLTAMPKELELQFNEDLQEMSLSMVLRHDDETVAELEPRLDGAVVRATPPDETWASGEYQLVYRVVSEDGHPLSGSVPFSLDVEEASAPADPTATPSAAAPATAEPSTSQASAAAEPDSSSTGVTAAIVVGVVVLALVGAVLVRRRSTQNPSQENS